MVTLLAYFIKNELSQLTRKDKSQEDYKGQISMTFADGIIIDPYMPGVGGWHSCVRCTAPLR